MLLSTGMRQALWKVTTITDALWKKGKGDLHARRPQDERTIQGKNISFYQVIWNCDKLSMLLKNGIYLKKGVRFSLLRCLLGNKIWKIWIGRSQKIGFLSKAKDTANFFYSPSCMRFFPLTSGFSFSPSPILYSNSPSLIFLLFKPSLKILFSRIPTSISFLFR